MRPKVVSERLGHASIGITLDTHSHVMPGMQEEEEIDVGQRGPAIGFTDVGASGSTGYDDALDRTSGAWWELDHHALPELLGHACATPCSACEGAAESPNASQDLEHCPLVASLVAALSPVL